MPHDTITSFLYFELLKFKFQIQTILKKMILQEHIVAQEN
jgi:hypothetical protein